ncbi:MAG: DUF4097 family beta strand repeat-containing protein [Candidatus Hydrogenedentota bacterium]
MKAYMATFVIVAGLAFQSAQAEVVAEDGKVEQVDGKWVQTVTRQLAFEPGGTLRVTSKNGNINVTAWDKNELLVTAEKHARPDTGGVKWVLEKLNIGFKDSDDVQGFLESVTINVVQTGSEIVVDATIPKRSDMSAWVSYDVKIPNQAALDLINSNGNVSVTGIQGEISGRSSNGKIQFEELSGKIICDTSNGRIELVNVDGPIQAGTSNGGISIEHSGELSVDDTISCETSNGSIRVAVPASSAFTLAARTSNGSVRTSFDVSRTDDGKRRSRLEGSVNGGGPLLDLRSSNGSISIESL